MDLHITLSRQLERSDDQSVYMHVVVDIPDDLQGSRRVEGDVRSIASTQHFVEMIVRYADRDGVRYLIEHLDDDFTGPASYVVPVVPMSDEHMEELFHVILSLEKIHFIAPRDEWVSNQDYYSFYGSEGVWRHTSDRYPAGDFVETMEQTVYEM